MARNSEKAQSMLFRFRAAQAASLGILDAGRTRRPKAITSVDSVPTCEKWRGQVLKEISRKVTKIQDPSLSDYQLRDLNDEINKLMREKYMWEVQIRQLGGPNYMRGGRLVDADGREVPGGGKGYRYFGRARELPGVKEMFEVTRSKAEDEEEGRPMEKRADLRRAVDAAYYGYNLDEEDGELLAYEARVEKENYERLLAEADLLNTGSDMGRKRDQEWEEIPDWRVPTAEEVQEELLDREKRRLLDKIG
ncbi:MAG: NineTeen Complex (NTC) component [Bathelium mastoideum]|nr:MAG: NineTeen Complex (NTC) component [Bathelium mastoideum]